MQMVELNINKEIGSEAFNDASNFFTTQNIISLFENNKEEQNFMLNISTNGGSVYDGLAQYDLIRNSSKNIYTNVIDKCHSIGVILLLSAPKENRSANPNARALIHEVRVNQSNFMTASELITMAEDVQKNQNAILDIYVERTGTDRDVLENLMKQEQALTAQELLKYGFISKINNYTTNKKTNEMSKQDKKGLVNQIDTFLSGLKNLLTNEPVNYDFMDADSVVLFSTEKEDDSLEVGDVAVPDGTFTIQDGRTIVIEGGVITEIQEVSSEEVATLEAEIENLQETVNKLKNSLKDAQSLMVEMKNEMVSTYNVAPRQKQIGKVQPIEKTVSDYKNEAKERKNLKQGGLK